MKHNKLIIRILLVSWAFFATVFLTSLSSLQSQNLYALDTVIINQLNRLPFDISFPYDLKTQNKIHALITTESYTTQQALGNFLECETFLNNSLQKEDIPLIFKYLPLALSNMQYRKIGTYTRAGAWQLPFLTALRYGLKIDSAIDQRFDFKESTHAATAYLQQLSIQYDNVWEIIVAFANSPAILNNGRLLAENSPSASNAGNIEMPNNEIITDFIAWVYVANYYKNNHIQPLVPDINDKFQTESQTVLITGKELKEGEKTAKPIPQDTVNEIVIDTPPEENIDSTDIVSTPISVTPIETPVAVSTPPASQKIEIPVTTPPPAKPIVKEAKDGYYIVQKGDYLGKIATQFNTTVEQLKIWNQLKDDKIYEDQKLIVKKNAAAATPSVSTRSTAVTPTAAQPPKKTTPSVSQPLKTPSATIIYIVQSGDNLTKIAKLYNVTVNSIMQCNGMQDDKIQIDQKLKICK